MNSYVGKSILCTDVFTNNFSICTSVKITSILLPLSVRPWISPRYFRVPCLTLAVEVMSGLPSLNCVRSQVPPSLSLHGISVRPPDYEPGLAALSLRCSVRGETRGEVRVVHGEEDIHTAVKEAVKEIWPENEVCS